MFTTFCLAALVAASGPAAPATATAIAEGDRIRIRFHAGADPLLGAFEQGRTRTAEVVTREDGTLLFRFDERKREPLVVPWSAMAKLERSLGRRSRPQGAIRGAGYGFVSGAAIGALLGAAFACDNCFFFRSRTAGGLYGAVVVGAPVATVGGVAGFLFPGEHWIKVPMTGARVTWKVGAMEPGRAGGSVFAARSSPGLAMSISF